MVDSVDRAVKRAVVDLVEMFVATILVGKYSWALEEHTRYM